MTSFWVVAGIFMVGALLFVIPTLWSRRERDESEAEREATNIRIYQDQLAELESDLRSDVLTREQYEQSKRELQQRMLQDIPAGEVATAPFDSNRNIATITVTALAVPLLAVSLYLALGNTKALLPQTAAEHPPMAAAEQGHPDFSSVMDNLVARLRDNPDDAEGWLMLGRTYAMLQRFNESKEAYERVLALTPDDAAVITDYADIVAMTNEGSLIGKPWELINKALSLDPDNPKALALAGTAEFERKRYKEAAGYWEKLLALIPPSESELLQSVNNSIAEARSLADGKGSLVARGPDQAPASQAPAGGGAPVSGSASAAGTAGSGSGTLSGTVTLSPALAAKASAGDSLYIFARAKVGPKAPLATLRLQVKDLPASFTLNDSMARSGVQLSSYPSEVVVGARISRSGSPMPQSGDLQGISQPARVGDSGINFVIDQQLP